MSFNGQKKMETENKISSYGSLFDDLALRGELSSNLVGFCHYLRINGLLCGLSEQTDALSALMLLDFQNEDDFRIALRITLAKSNNEQEIFDKYFRLFWYVWEGVEDLKTRFQSKKTESVISVVDERPQKQGFVSLNDWLGINQETTEEKDAAGYSPFQTFSERDFSTFQIEEITELTQLISEVGKALATQFSRRTINSKKRGPIDFRRTMRKSLRRGGEILDLARNKHRRQRLKLVLICDVSKSMDLYSRFLIQFIYAFQSVYRRIETFVFSTSLHQITEILRNKEIHNVLEELSINVPDWSGGTKIGFSLSKFVDQYGIKLVDSHTVCLIISDGWDTGDVDLLESSMRFLKKRSRHIIWLNPLKGSSGYEPSTRGMQVALPYIDTFDSAHNLVSLKKLVRHLVNIRC